MRPARGRGLRCALLLAASAVGIGPHHAEEAARPTLSLDPNLSVETGSDLNRACVGLLGRLESRPSLFAERRRSIGIPIRAARTLVFDLPVAWWFTVLEHEGFGHAGRAREFGSRASFHMGSPWGGRDSYATFSTRGLSNEEILRVFAGGSEADGWTATLLERDLVAGARMRSLDLLFLAASRYVTSRYVLHTTPDPEASPGAFWAEWSGGGDVANYLGELDVLRSGTLGITPRGSSVLVRTEYRRLRRQAIWNALDPGAWLALWGVGRSVLTGEEFPVVPLPAFRGRRFLPVLSADWLPDGGAVSLELIVGSPGPRTGDGAPEWSSVTVRRGRGPWGAYTAAGSATERVWEGSFLRIGGEGEVWFRPGRNPGAGIRARISARRGRLRDVFLEVGAKSSGPWPGRPAEPGPFLRIGVRLPAGARVEAPAAPTSLPRFDPLAEN